MPGSFLAGQFLLILCHVGLKLWVGIKVRAVQGPVEVLLRSLDIFRSQGGPMGLIGTLEGRAVADSGIHDNQAGLVFLSLGFCNGGA